MSRAIIISTWRMICPLSYVVDFFQAEDGIRDLTVTGVQTCALPICKQQLETELDRMLAAIRAGMDPALAASETRKIQADLTTTGAAIEQWERSHERPATLKIGRASCRERV